MTEQASPSDQPQAYAGLYMRLKAGLMDWTFCAFFASIIAIVMITSFESGPWIFPVGVSISVIAAWLYFALYESSAAGATPGKKRYQISVRDSKGSRVTFKKASIRFVGKLVTLNTYLLLMIPILFNQRRRALQDFMADTVVIDNLKIAHEKAHSKATPSEKITHEIVHSEAAPSKPKDSRGSGKNFLLDLVIFLVTAYVAYHFFGSDWKAPSERVSSIFPVVVKLPGKDGPTFQSVGWYQLENSLDEHSDWKLDLPVGHKDITTEGSGDEPEYLTFDVKPIDGGIRVEVNHRDGSYDVDATYTVINNKVNPEKMHSAHAMTLIAAIFIAILITYLVGWVRKNSV
jgi:uncharacterized RDD family membrane protein YckC